MSSDVRKPLRPMLRPLPAAMLRDDDDDDAETAPILARPPLPTVPPPALDAPPSSRRPEAPKVAPPSPEQAAYGRILRKAWTAPFEPLVYKELYAHAVTYERFDLALRALDILMVVGAPNRDQVAWLLENPAPELAAFPHALGDETWPLLGGAERDPILTSLLGWTAGAWARAAVTRGMEAGRRPTIHPPLRGSHSNLFPFLAETTERGAKALGLVPPSLLVGSPSGPPFSLALDPWGALLVCVPSAEARGDSAYFDLLVALAYLRADLTLAALAPSADALRAHVRAALDSSPELLAFVDATEQQAVAHVLVHARRDWAGEIPDVERWIATSREVALRAALTLCGSVQDAQLALGGVSAGRGHPALGRLFPWFVGPESGLLRQKLGIALPGPPESVVL